MTQNQPQPSSAPHAFVGTVPPIYDRHLGPVIFAPYADDLAARLRPRANARVLEVACGTGIVTSRLLAREGGDRPWRGQLRALVVRAMK
jgi:hypothetical protein